jgi:hypothetical protein
MHALMPGLRKDHMRPEPDEFKALRLYVQADMTAQTLYGLLGEWGPPMPNPGPEGGTIEDRPDGWREIFNASIARLRQLRGQLRAMDHACPTLPSGLESIDREMKEVEDAEIME